jgi:hypothetical protein
MDQILRAQPRGTIRIQFRCALRTGRHLKQSATDILWRFSRAL